MLPFQNSNSNRHTSEYSDGSCLTRKASRPSMSCKSLPYNGSSSCYINSPPPYLEGPPPPRSEFRQPTGPTILSLHQPYQKQMDGPFLVPPPVSSPSFYGARQRQRNGWQPHSPTYATIPEDAPLLNQVLTDVRQDRGMGPNVSWYCERKPIKPKNTFRKYFFRLVVLVALGFTAFQLHKNGFFEVDHRIRLENIRDVYNTVMENEWVVNLTNEYDAFFAKRQLKPVEYTNPAPTPHVEVEIQKNPLKIETPEKPVQTNVIFSLNEDFETTVEVIND